MKPRILILCTHNSSRSQMAEGLLRHLAGDAVEVMSAGSEPSRVHPLAVQAMAQRGIDISGQRSKSLNEYLGQPFDFIVTVCDDAAETCPFFAGRAERIHWSFPDPSAVTGSDEDKLATFVRVRNGLETRLSVWLSTLMPDAVQA
jgi:arsenate reductase (thioredoxin)